MEKIDKDNFIQRQEDKPGKDSGKNSGFGKTIGPPAKNYTAARDATYVAPRTTFFDTKSPIQNGGKAIKGKGSSAGATNDDKTITLSRGVLQLTSEGDFSGTENDITVPCIPLNVHLYEKLTDEEKGTDDKKGTVDVSKRYKDTGDSDVFKQSDTGDYKKGEAKSRYKSSSYTLGDGDKTIVGADNYSGVTIGFGIDLGNGFNKKADIISAFKNAGILDADGKEVNGNKADKLPDTFGLKGIPAAKKAAELRSVVKLTQDQVLTLLNQRISDNGDMESTDEKSERIGGFKIGDGTYETPTEEALMAIAFWGETALYNAIAKAAKGKKGIEQYRAASTAATTAKKTLPANSWKIKGYNTYISYFDMLAEMVDSGYTIKFQEGVSDAKTLTDDKSGDDTLQFVKDLNERVGGYQSAGKDMKKQMVGTALPDTIKDKVGETTSKATKTTPSMVTPCTNAEADVKAVQQLLYNGDYDVEVNGTFDDKTRSALTLFASTEFSSKKYKGFVAPGSNYIIRLRKYKYKKRTKI